MTSKTGFITNNIVKTKRIKKMIVKTAQPKPSIPQKSSKAFKVSISPVFRLLFWIVIAGLILAILPNLVVPRKFELLSFETENQSNAVVLEGFYPVERNATGGFRWIGSTARINLPETLTPKRISLQVSAAYPEEMALAPRLHLYYGGQEIGNWEVGKDWSHLETSFPSEPKSITSPLELKVENPLPPRKGDERTLGVAIQTLELEVGHFPSKGAIVTLLLLGLGIGLVAYWCAIKTRHILFLAILPMLILTVYWQSNRLSAPLVVGWLLLGALASALLTLYNQAFVTPRLYRKLSRLLPPVLLTGFTVAIYHNSLAYGFFSDDYHIARPWSFGEVLGTFGGSWDPLGIERAFYRPLTSASFALDFSLWGYAAQNYHLVNLVIHTANAWLLYLLLRRFGLVWTLAIAGAVFFLVLPADAATAVWISQRSDVLVVFFVLGGILAFDNYIRKRRWEWLVALLTGLALGTKEIGVALPLLLGLYSILFLLPDLLSNLTIIDNKNIRRKITELLMACWKVAGRVLVSTFGVLLVYSGWRTLVLPQQPGGSPFTLSGIWTNFYTALNGSFYGLNKIGGLEVAPWLTLAILTGFVLITVIVVRKQLKSLQVLSFGLGWVIIGCLPLSLLSIVYSGKQNFDLRVLYLPEVGYAIVFVSLLDLLLKPMRISDPPWRLWIGVTFTSILFLLLALFYRSVETENQSIQAQFAPYSFLTLERDKLIYFDAKWKKLIPPVQYQAIEKKLKEHGELKL